MVDGNDKIFFGHQNPSCAYNYAYGNVVIPLYRTQLSGQKEIAVSSETKVEYILSSNL